MSRPNKVSHKLKDVVRRELGLELDKDHQKANWSGQLTDEMLAYAATDTKVLLPLADALALKAKEAKLELAAEIECRALPAMTWMANAGLPFDRKGWTEHLKGLEKEKSLLTKELDELVPEGPDGKARNWNSHLQVKEAFGLAGIELPNIQEKTLSRIDHPLAKTLLKYKKVSTMLSNYGPKLLEFVSEGDRIYADWHQIGAGTGRMSCSKPALQQLTPEVKKYVRAPDGRVLIKADYSQIELRIAAKVSGDERMLEAYQRGEDLHSLTAKSLAHAGVGKEADRRLAKAINFGLLYGQGAKGFKEFARDKYDTDITLGEARQYKRRFFETYPGLAAWHERERLRMKHGETETRTLTGRRRVGVTRFTEWVNAPVQGTGADGLKLALALLRERLGECPGAVPIACVHDEIVVECDEDKAEKVEAWLEKAMINGMDEVLNSPQVGGPRVPVEVETQIGKTWAR
jgi:DNA polymerase I